MSQVVIENPIINSPFDEPTRHFRFTDEGITNEEVDVRRTSSYFIPIAKPKKKGAQQLQFDTEWTQDRIEENKLVNDIRRRVALWRKGGYVGVTPTTARLIAYWTDPNREKKLFFCQNEALETAIYIAEVAKKYGDAWIENSIREANDTSNPGLPRTAFKMATGSGKTVVMAMLIAWHTLNKRANPQDARFSDTFLIVTPGITIRDRLRVLWPNDPENYYRQRDIVPAQLQDELGQAKIIITNYHAFQLREKVAAGKTRRVAVSLGPEHGTVGPQQVKEAAKEAVQGIGFDMLIVCGFAFDPHVAEEVKRYGKLTVLPAKMNPDLAMSDELLKKTGAGNLFMVFGEPDVEIKKQKGGEIVVEIKGVDVYDPTTGQIRSASTDDIACWFIDSNYNGESFFVRHAYFTGADEPYDKLKRALRAEIDETAWSSLYSTVSRAFPKPESGKIAVKVINHYGDEVLKVFGV